MEFFKTFNKIKIIFTAYINNLRSNSRIADADELDNYSNLVSDIFFHNIRMCSNETYFPDVKSAVPIQMLNGRMKEEISDDVRIRLLKTIPRTITEVKILLPTKLFRILEDKHPSFFQEIIDCFDAFDKNLV